MNDVTMVTIDARVFKKKCMVVGVFGCSIWSVIT